MIIVTQSELPALLPMPECIEVVARVLETVARGEAVLPLRQQVILPDGSGRLVTMPAFTAEPAALGLKVITVFPGNEGTAFDSHQGAVLLFEPEHGQLLAVMDASSITARRTAAASVTSPPLPRASASTSPSGASVVRSCKPNWPSAPNRRIFMG